MGLSHLKSLKCKNRTNQFIWLISELYLRCTTYNHPFLFFVPEGFQSKAIDAQPWNSYLAEISCLCPKIPLKVKNQVMELVTESSK